jgi:hypothetical protein
MSSQVAVKASETLPAAASANFFEKYGKAATSRSVVGNLLKFTKFGEYKFGAYDEDLARGTKLIAYMQSFSAGYIRWEASRPAETIMGPVGEGFVPPKRETLGYLDQAQWERFDDGRSKDPWAFTNTLILLRQQKTGDEWFTFTTSSRGGLSALGELSLAHGNRMRQKPGELPIVELDVGSYQHPNRAYGEVRFPVFKVVDWVAAASLPELEGFEPAAQVAGNGKQF